MNQTKYRCIKFALISALAFSVIAEEVVDQKAVDKEMVAKETSNQVIANKKQAYKKIQWVELMPPEDMKALYNPPEELINIPEGGEGDDVSSEVFATLMQAMDSDYQSALSSTKIIEALDKTKIKIPGFVVPVTIEGDKTTEFFIVPYFGACLHYPAPPPNQTIYAQYKPGFELDNMYEPYDFSGLLTTSIKENELATAAYNLDIELVENYTE